MRKIQGTPPLFARPASPDVSRQPCRTSLREEGTPRDQISPET
jgi:hypothetical protein